jgi:putative phosphoribosyl transferase
VNPGVYHDRRDAGRVLAQAVAAASLPGVQNAIVLGLVRGGVPVAYEVAMTLELPLDIMIVRKIGAPGNREFAMGAVASGGAVVLNPEVVRAFHLTEEKLRHAVETHQQEIDRLEALYRQGRPQLQLAGRTIILVDDGLATGASMRAALRAVRPIARHVTVAVPVAAPSTAAELSKEVDHMVCAMMPEPLEAVSLFYRDFSPTSDEEVQSLLADARRRLDTKEKGTREKGPFTPL